MSLYGDAELRRLIQKAFKKFDYEVDSSIIKATLDETLGVLKGDDPPLENVIEEICLAKSCAAGSNKACRYFTDKYQETIKKSTRYRIGKLELTGEIVDKLDDVAHHILGCLLYGKNAYEKCPPSYTLEKFDRKRASLETFIKNLIKPKKGMGIIKTYMHREGIWKEEKGSSKISVADVKFDILVPWLKSQLGTQSLPITSLIDLIRNEVKELEDVLEKYDQKNLSEQQTEQIKTNIVKGLNEFEKSHKGFLVDIIPPGSLKVKKEKHVKTTFEDYMTKEDTMASQAREILELSKEEMEGAIDRLFELCRPEDLDIIVALAQMYEVKGPSRADVNGFKTNYMVSFVEKDGYKKMTVKNKEDRDFFSNEEIKFQVCFVLGFQLKWGNISWMQTNEIFDRIFEEDSLTTPKAITQVITGIKNDLSSDGFNKDLLEIDKGTIKYRLSAKPSQVSFEAENRYLRLWFFYESGRVYKKGHIRAMKKRASDRWRGIGGDEFDDLFGEE